MGRKKRLVIFLFLLLFFACKKEPVEQITEKKEEIKSEKKFRTYVIYFAGEENISTATKIITIEEKENDMENLKSLLENYFSLKNSKLYPEGTFLRAIYSLEKNLVVDIGIPEDTIPLQSIKEELSFVSGIAKTICLNFPRFKAINLLINGNTENKFINHIALHISYKP